MRAQGHQKYGTSKGLGFSTSASYCERDNVCHFCHQRTNVILGYHLITRQVSLDASETRALLGIFPYFLGFPSASCGGLFSASAFAAEQEYNAAY